MLIRASLIALWCSAITEFVTFVAIGHRLCRDCANPRFKSLNVFAVRES